jgi:hypothetical protein
VLSFNTMSRQRLGLFLLASVLALGLVMVGTVPANAAVSYYLPYPNGERYKVTQGPGGSTSHTGTYSAHAIDFNLTSSDNIAASAPGTLYKKDPAHASLGRVVYVKHSDGYCTLYAHMSSYSSEVAAMADGAAISQGQVLGKAGETGLATGVHLHFGRAVCSSSVTVDVDFVEIAEPVEGQSYTSQNNGGGNGGGGGVSTANNDVFQATGTSWRVSHNGTGAWDSLRDSETLASTMAIGDFDEDGKEDDVFQASGVDGVGWRVSYNGNSSWEFRRNSTTTMNTLLLGDFDGDGKKNDVFQATGDPNLGFRYSSDGNQTWTQLRLSGATADNLGIGDFDGDGHEDDVFYATGSNWLVSMNGTGSWQTLRTSGVTMSTLKFGNFDGDNKTDVFDATGLSTPGWRVSHDGTGSWVVLRSSTTAANTLAIGDFDEDGREDDVFQASGVYGVGWRVSMNGTGSWIPLMDSGTTMDTLFIGDFD